MTRNHQVFVRRDYANGATAFWNADDGCMFFVLGRIQNHSQELEIAAYLLAHGRCAFTDSAGEDQGIESAQHCRKCTYKFARSIAEHCDCLIRVWIGASL